MVTKRTYEALAILRASQGSQPALTAAWFALKFWPGHPMHERVKRNGVRGCGAWLSAGSFLAKLITAKLANWHGGVFTITTPGMAALAEYEAAHPAPPADVV